MDREPTIPFSNDKFIEEANRHVIRAKFLTHETGHHSFDVLDDNERTRQIIRETMAFLQENLK